MAKYEELERGIRVLQDVEAIKKLKAKYWRCVDQKLWDEWAECFTGDATMDVAGGVKLRGRKEIVRGISERLRSTVTVHQGHNPEIEVTSGTTARGTWSLYDFIIDKQSGATLGGYGLYEDEYIKDNSGWKIKSTKLTRFFTERWKRES